jgi:hypothetical protein
MGGPDPGRAARFVPGLALGLLPLLLSGILEAAHTLHALGDLVSSPGEGALFLIAALGPVCASAVLAGLALGLILLLVHGTALAAGRLLARSAERPRAVWTVEGLLLAAIGLAAWVAAGRLFDAPFRRILNAAVHLARPYVPGLEEVFFERRLPALGLAAAGLLPAGLFAVLWWRAQRPPRSAPGPLGPTGSILRSLLAALAAAAGIGLHLTTATFYVNQYREFHLAGLLGTTFLFAAALLLLPQGARARLLFRAQGRRALPVLLVLAAVSLGAAHHVLETRLSVEAQVLWRTNLARKAILVLRGIADRDGDGHAAVLGGDDEDDTDPTIGPWSWVEADPAGAPLDPPPLGPSLPRPVQHLVFLSIDAWRTDVTGFLGAADSATPALDALARDGVRFHRAYAPGSFTHVTYPAILRGRHPVGPPPPGALPFPAILGSHGIATTGIFCAFFSYPGGFQHLDLGIPHDAPTPSQASTRLVREAVARGDPRSFLWVHFIDPHEPYVDRSPDGGVRTAFGRYRTEMRAADAAVAALVLELRGTLGPETAFCVFSDHGEEFGEHGSSYHGITVYEELIRVPLLLLVPGLAARDVHAPVSLIHLAASALDLFHVDPPRDLHARSLLPALLDPPRGPLPASGLISVNNDDMIAYVDPGGRWKLIHDRRLDFAELYDLEADPRERRNLVDVDRPRFEALRSEYRSWRAAALAR